MSSGLLVASHGRPKYYLWVSPHGVGESWTSRTLVGDGFGYTSIAEADPGVLALVADGKVPDGRRGLVAWRIAVSRAQ